MKKIYYIILFILGSILFSAILSSCMNSVIPVTMAAARKEVKKKSAPVKKGERTFTPGPKTCNIINNTAADIECTSGSPEVRITGPEGIIALIEVKEKGENLEFSVKSDGKSDWNKVHIYVRLNTLSGITLTGSGDFTAKKMTGDAVSARSVGSGDLKTGSVSGTTVRFSTAGSGDINVESIDAGVIQLLSQGSGDISVSKVSATSVKMQSQGTGDINIGLLSGSGCDIISQGTSEITIGTVSLNSLKIMNQGTGDINLGGRAGSVFLHNSGTGDINIRGLKSDAWQLSSTGLGNIYR